MKEYQRIRPKDYVLPKEVYYQCIWIVRDMERTQWIIDELGEEWPQREEALIRMECIYRALEDIPENYRQGVLENIQRRGQGFDTGAHENTWKRYKQIFLFSLAHRLLLC